MNTFVIDASTSLKWVLNDEIYIDQARQVLKDYLSNKIKLIAPNIWAYEITNALKSAILRNRLTYTQSQNLLSLLNQSAPILLPTEEMRSEFLATAHKYQISVYDSAYLTLAIDRKIKFISADKKLWKNGKLNKSPILMLKNYKS